MRIALKLTAVILCLLVIVLGMEAALRLREERQVLVRDVHHEQHLLGNALRSSIEIAWHTYGPEAARSVLRRAELAEGEVSIRMVEIANDAPESMRPVLPVSNLEILALGQEVSYTEQAKTPWVIYTYVPLHVPHKHTMALELSESMLEADVRLRRSAWRVAGTALILILSGGVLSMLVGEFMLGRPVRKLINRAQRIGEGDLSHPGPAQRRDEMGELKQAIASMVEGLSAARRKALEETEGRLVAQKQLRHSERLATVGTLAAGLAHELGTPLQIVSGRARMIELDKVSSNDGRRNAEIIRQQCKRMEKIVRQLLDFARPSGSVRHDLKAGDVVRDVVSLLSPMADEHQVEICVEEHNNQASFRVEPELINQLLTNLINNAIQAMENGGVVSVSIDSLEKQPPVSTKLAKKVYVAIQISDQGKGIVPEQLLHVFDPFYTTKDVGQGTGLGLSVAYGIAQDHAGWIEVENRQQKGASFTVYLPALESNVLPS
jgi:two-component system, NtrC family, sensor kinase